MVMDKDIGATKRLQEDRGSIEERATITSTLRQGIGTRHLKFKCFKNLRKTKTSLSKVKRTQRLLLQARQELSIDTSRLMDSK